LSAVHKLVASKYVDILADGKRTSVSVETGISDDTDVEVVSGLSEGQHILSGRAAPPEASAAAAGPAPVTAASAITATAPAASTATPVPSTASTTSFAANTPSVNALNQAVLDEHFSDNRIQWPSEPQSSAWLESGAYHLEPRQPGKFVAVSAPLPNVPKDVEVTATFLKVGGPAGGGYGLLLRNQQSLDGKNQRGSFYVFEVGDQGDVGVWRRDDLRWVDLLPWTRSDVVRSGRAENQLTAQIWGDQLTFVVNDQIVANLRDATLADGGVGLFAGGDGNEVVVKGLTVLAPQP
jgi:hypothetical protein